jgi:hypothetical protein
MKKDQEEQEQKNAEAAMGKTNTKGKNKKEKPITISLPIWKEKCNDLLSMLNLPGIIQHFDSPRHYFEGKYLGELFVQQDVKNMRPCCPPKQVVLNLQQKLQETKSIEGMTGLQSKNYRLYEVHQSGVLEGSTATRNSTECKSVCKP